MIGSRLYLLVVGIAAVTPHSLIPASQQNATVQNPVLTKILQAIDETRDDHLFEITLRLLRGVCVCMHETLKAKQEISDDNNADQNNNDTKGSHWKEIDLYKKIYNKTCFDLRQELASKINYKFDENDDESYISKWQCGKKNEVRTEEMEKSSTTPRPVVKNNTKGYLERLLFKALVQTKDFHKYNVRTHNLFGNAIPYVHDPTQHSIIVIVTLHPKFLKKQQKPSKVSDAEINSALQTNSPIEIDILDTTYNPKAVMRSGATRRSQIVLDCMVRSVYAFLVESEKMNMTKVFKLLRKKENIKIYTEILTRSNHSDYVGVCCNNASAHELCQESPGSRITKGTPKPDHYKLELIKLQKATNENYKDTINKIMNLVKLYDEKLKYENKTDDLIDQIEKPEISKPLDLNIYQEHSTKIPRTSSSATRKSVSIVDLTKLQTGSLKNYLVNNVLKIVDKEQNTTNNILDFTKPPSVLELHIKELPMKETIKTLNDTNKDKLTSVSKSDADITKTNITTNVDENHFMIDHSTRPSIIQLHIKEMPNTVNEAANTVSDFISKNKVNSTINILSSPSTTKTQIPKEADQFRINHSTQPSILEIHIKEMPIYTNQITNTTKDNDLSKVSVPGDAVATKAHDRYTTQYFRSPTNIECHSNKTIILNSTTEGTIGKLSVSNDTSITNQHYTQHFSEPHHLTIKNLPASKITTEKQMKFTENKIKPRELITTTDKSTTKTQITRVKNNYNIFNYSISPRGQQPNVAEIALSHTTAAIPITTADDKPSEEPKYSETNSIESHNMTTSNTLFITTPDNNITLQPKTMVESITETQITKVESHYKIFNFAFPSSVQQLNIEEIASNRATEATHITTAEDKPSEMPEYSEANSIEFDTKPVGTAYNTVTSKALSTTTSSEKLNEQPNATHEITSETQKTKTKNFYNMFDSSIPLSVNIEEFASNKIIEATPITTAADEPSKVPVHSEFNSIESDTTPVGTAYNIVTYNVLSTTTSIEKHNQQPKATDKINTETQKTKTENFYNMFKSSIPLSVNIEEIASNKTTEATPITTADDEPSEEPEYSEANLTESEMTQVDIAYNMLPFNELSITFSDDNTQKPETFDNISNSSTASSKQQLNIEEISSNRTTESMPVTIVDNEPSEVPEYSKTNYIESEMTQEDTDNNMLVSVTPKISTTVGKFSQESRLNDDRTTDIQIKKDEIYYNMLNFSTPSSVKEFNIEKITSVKTTEVVPITTAENKPSKEPEYSQANSIKVTTNDTRTLTITTSDDRIATDEIAKESQITGSYYMFNSSTLSSLQQHNIEEITMYGTTEAVPISTSEGKISELPKFSDVNCAEIQMPQDNTIYSLPISSALEMNTDGKLIQEPRADDESTKEIKMTRVESYHVIPDSNTPPSVQHFKIKDIKSNEITKPIPISTTENKLSEVPTSSYLNSVESQITQIDTVDNMFISKAAFTTSTPDKIRQELSVTEEHQVTKIESYQDVLNSSRLPIVQQLDIAEILMDITSEEKLSTLADDQLSEGLAFNNAGTTKTQLLNTGAANTLSQNDMISTIETQVPKVDNEYMINLKAHPKQHVEEQPIITNKITKKLAKITTELNNILSTNNVPTEVENTSPSIFEPQREEKLIIPRAETTLSNADSIEMSNKLIDKNYSKITTEKAFHTMLSEASTSADSSTSETQIANEDKTSYKYLASTNKQEINPEFNPKEVPTAMNEFVSIDSLSNENSLHFENISFSEERIENIKNFTESTTQEILQEVNKSAILNFNSDKISANDPTTKFIWSKINVTSINNKNLEHDTDIAYKNVNTPKSVISILKRENETTIIATTNNKMDETSTSNYENVVVTDKTIELQKIIVPTINTISTDSRTFVFDNKPTFMLDDHSVLNSTKSEENFDVADIRYTHPVNEDHQNTAKILAETTYGMAIIPALVTKTTILSQSSNSDEEDENISGENLAYGSNQDNFDDSLNMSTTVDSTVPPFTKQNENNIESSSGATHFLTQIPMTSNNNIDLPYDEFKNQTTTAPREITNDFRDTKQALLNINKKSVITNTENKSSTVYSLEQSGKSISVKESGHEMLKYLQPMKRSTVINTIKTFPTSLFFMNPTTEENAVSTYQIKKFSIEKNNTLNVSLNEEQTTVYPEHNYFSSYTEQSNRIKTSTLPHTEEQISRGTKHEFEFISSNYTENVYQTREAESVGNKNIDYLEISKLTPVNMMKKGPENMTENYSESNTTDDGNSYQDESEEPLENADDSMLNLTETTTNLTLNQQQFRHPSSQNRVTGTVIETLPAKISNVFKESQIIDLPITSTNTVNELYQKRIPKVESSFVQMQVTEPIKSDFTEHQALDARNEYGFSVIVINNITSVMPTIAFSKTKHADEVFYATETPLNTTQVPITSTSNTHVINTPSKVRFVEKYNEKESFVTTRTAPIESNILTSLEEDITNFTDYDDYKEQSNENNTAIIEEITKKMNEVEKLANLIELTAGRIQPDKYNETYSAQDTFNDKTSMSYMMDSSVTTHNFPNIEMESTLAKNENLKALLYGSSPLNYKHQIIPSTTLVTKSMLQPKNNHSTNIIYRGVENEDGIKLTTQPLKVKSTAFILNTEEVTPRNEIIGYNTNRSYVNKNTSVSASVTKTLINEPNADVKLFEATESLQNHALTDRPHSKDYILTDQTAAEKPTSIDNLSIETNSETFDEKISQFNSFPEDISHDTITETYLYTKYQSEAIKRYNASNELSNIEQTKGLIHITTKLGLANNETSDTETISALNKNGVTKFDGLKSLTLNMKTDKDKSSLTVTKGSESTSYPTVLTTLHHNTVKYVQQKGPVGISEKQTESYGSKYNIQETDKVTAMSATVSLDSDEVEYNATMPPQEVLFTLTMTPTDIITLSSKETSDSTHINKTNNETHKETYHYVIFKAEDSLSIQSNEDKPNRYTHGNVTYKEDVSVQSNEKKYQGTKTPNSAKKLGSKKTFKGSGTTTQQKEDASHLSNEDLAVAPEPSNKIGDNTSVKDNLSELTNEEVVSGLIGVVEGMKTKDNEFNKYDVSVQSNDIEKENGEKQKHIVETYMHNEKNILAQEKIKDLPSKYAIITNTEGMSTVKNRNNISIPVSETYKTINAANIFVLINTTQQEKLTATTKENASFFRNKEWTEGKENPPHETTTERRKKPTKAETNNTGDKKSGKLTTPEKEESTENDGKKSKLIDVPSEETAIVSVLLDQINKASFSVENDDTKSSIFIEAKTNSKEINQPIRGIDPEIKHDLVKIKEQLTEHSPLLNLTEITTVNPKSTNILINSKENNTVIYNTKVFIHKELTTTTQNLPFVTNKRSDFNSTDNSNLTRVETTSDSVTKNIMHTIRPELKDTKLNIDKQHSKNITKIIIFNSDIINTQTTKSSFNLSSQHTTPRNGPQNYTESKIYYYPIEIVGRISKILLPGQAYHSNFTTFKINTSTVKKQPSSTVNNEPFKTTSFKNISLIHSKQNNAPHIDHEYKTLFSVTEILTLEKNYKVTNEIDKRYTRLNQTVTDLYDIVTDISTKAYQSRIKTKNGTQTVSMQKEWDVTIPNLPNIKNGTSAENISYYFIFPLKSDEDKELTSREYQTNLTYKNPEAYPILFESKAQMSNNNKVYMNKSTSELSNKTTTIPYFIHNTATKTTSSLFSTVNSSHETTEFLKTTENEDVFPITPIALLYPEENKSSPEVDSAENAKSRLKNSTSDTVVNVDDIVDILEGIGNIMLNDSDVSTTESSPVKVSSSTTSEHFKKHTNVLKDHFSNESYSTIFNNTGKKFEQNATDDVMFLIIPDKVLKNINDIIQPKFEFYNNVTGTSTNIANSIYVTEASKKSTSQSRFTNVTPPLPKMFKQTSPKLIEDDDWRRNNLVEISTGANPKYEQLIPPIGPNIYEQQLYDSNMFIPHVIIPPPTETYAKRRHHKVKHEKVQAKHNKQESNGDENASYSDTDFISVATEKGNTLPLQRKKDLTTTYYTRDITTIEPYSKTVSVKPTKNLAKAFVKNAVVTRSTPRSRTRSTPKARSKSTTAKGRSKSTTAKGRKKTTCHRIIYTYRPNLARRTTIKPLRRTPKKSKTVAYNTYQPTIDDDLDIDNIRPIARMALPPVRMRSVTKIPIYIRTAPSKNSKTTKKKVPIVKPAERKAVIYTSTKKPTKFTTFAKIQDNKQSVIKGVTRYPIRTSTTVKKVSKGTKVTIKTSKPPARQIYNVSTCTDIKKIVTKTIKELKAMLKAANCSEDIFNSIAKKEFSDIIEPTKLNKKGKNSVTLPTRRTKYENEGRTVSESTTELNVNSKIKAIPVNLDSNVSKLSESKTNQNINIIPVIKSKPDNRTYVPIRRRLYNTENVGESKSINENQDQTRSLKPVEAKKDYIVNQATLINKINNLSVKINYINNDQFRRHIHHHNTKETGTTAIPTLLIKTSTSKKIHVNKSNFNNKRITVTPTTTKLTVKSKLTTRPIDDEPIKNRSIVQKPMEIKQVVNKIARKSNTNEDGFGTTKSKIERLSHNTETVSSTTQKTVLHPVSKHARETTPKDMRSSVKTIQVGKNRKEIMAVSTKDFFSQKRLKNVIAPVHVKPKTTIMRQRPLLLHKPRTLERELLLTPTFSRMKPDQPMPLLSNEFYRFKNSPYQNDDGNNFRGSMFRPSFSLPMILETKTSKPRPLLQPEKYFLESFESADTENDRRLFPKSHFQEQPVTDWWLDDMYMKIRLPLPINSSPGMVFPKRHFAKMEEVADLGALFVDDLLDYKEMLDRGELPLERATSREKGQPLCMEQFYRLLGVCRIAEVGRDRLEFPPVQQGEREELIVVAVRNYFYPIPVKATDRGRLTPGEIQAQLLHAMVDAAGAPAAPRVGLLTAMNRDQWARAREILLRDENNRTNLELISRALCILCLDESGGDLADDEDTSSMLRAMHGAGTKNHSANRWFDKTVQLIISSDGTVGMCYEHSAAEGVAVIRLAERALARAEVSDRPAPPPALLPAPQAMKWNLTPDLTKTIDLAGRDLDRAIADLDFKVYTYKGYGREFMKSCRTSPDVYIQLALQYAYYKMYGYLVSTYESASLRRFRNGRVDNIRSAHNAAKAWAAAMCTAENSPMNDLGDDNQRKVSFNLYGEQKKLELFEAAARKQTEIMEANILGRGIDNHLLGLREAARETLGHLPPLFNDQTYKQMIEYKLSTSQVSTTTDGTFMGYGAVVPDGYGCSYNPKKESVIFCIASFVSSSVTNTEAFRQSLEEALDSMRLMFQHRKVEG